LFARLACEPDPRARQRLRERLVEGHRRLAFSVVARFADTAARVRTAEGGQAEFVEDLGQVALLGLVQAVDRFDPTTGVRFSTFATATIYGCLRRYLRDRGTLVRPPRSHQETSAAAERAAQALQAEWGRRPTTGEIAARLNATEEEVLAATAATAGTARLQSLESPVQEHGASGGTLTLHDLLGREDPALAALLSHAGLYEALRALPPEQRRVLALRFWAGMSQRAAAGHLGVSQMTVSRLEKSALARLRKLLRAGGV
jgi:RNA polymerase sigma-B factor